MNKDVIYIEPDEDITDIIAKIEGSKSKIVALVPPKKAGVFRSIVNIKLITKSAAASKKAVVLVTTDPSIIKLAAATRMPVTKDLQTAPAVPEAETEEIEETEVVDVDDNAEEAADEPAGEADDAIDDNRDGTDDENDTTNDDENAEIEIDETEVEESEIEAKPAKNESKNTAKSARSAVKADSSGVKKKEPKDSGTDKKPRRGLFSRLAESNNRFLSFIGGHPKLVAGTGVGLVVVIMFAIWAFAIAPAATITLELETVTGNFSENITFTDTLTKEDVSSGLFYIQEKKIESKSEVEFEATGSKNVGEKATGTIKVTHYFPLTEEGGTIAVGSGATFTNSGLNYIVTSGAQISWDGDLTAAEKDCENYSSAGWRNRGCAVSATVKVEAAESGAKYNISSTSSGWASSVSRLDVISNEAMSGGSDKTVTVVQQSDIDAALGKISTENESVNKQKLLDTVGEGEFAIESSFKQTRGEAVSTPKVGEEVESGKKAKLSVTTTDTLYVIDEVKLKEFITEKAKLAEGYKIYEMSDPFIENFSQTTSGYAGKLKTSYIAGSTITENDVVETVKGKGIGTAKRDLSDNFDGIKTITIDTAVPWMTSIPGNPEKITVKIDVKE